MKDRHPASIPMKSRTATATRAPEPAGRNRPGSPVGDRSRASMAMALGWLALAACNRGEPATVPATQPEVAARQPDKLVFGAFTGGREVLGTRLLPRFAKKWQRER